MIGLAAIMAMLTPASRPALADHTALALSPSPLFLSPGDQDVIDVWVFGLDGSGRIAGYELSLDYDPAVITVDAVTGGDGQNPVFMIDNKAGRVTLSRDRIRVGDAEDVLLARIDVAAVGNVDASTALTFASVALTDILGEAVETATVMDGSATVSNTAVMVGTSVVAKGGTTTIPVTIIFTPEGGLAGYNISIGYDPSIIQIYDISAGESPFGGPPIFSVNKEESIVNIVGFHGERPGPVGRMNALNFQVTGLARGASLLEITVKDLVNAIDSTSWPATTSSGSVRVVSELAGGPQRPTSATETFSFAVDKDSALDGAVVSDITPALGVVVALPNNIVVLTIPAGAVAESGFVALRIASDNPSPPVPINHDLGNTIEVNLLDGDGVLLSDVLLLEPAVLKMKFTEHELDTWGLNGILIQRYEPALSRWLPLFTTIDTDEMAALAASSRFSVFALTFVLSEPNAESQQDQENIATQPSVNASGPTIGSGDQDSSGSSSERGYSLVIVALAVLVAVGIVSGVGYGFLRRRD